MRKGCWTLLGIVVISIGFIAASATAAEYKMRLAHMTPLIESHARAGVWIKDEIEKRSKGRMEVQYFHSFQLGNTIEITKKCQMGMIEAAYTNGNILPDMAPEFGIGYCPYVLDSYEKWTKFLANDELRNELFQYGEKRTGLMFVDQMWFGRYVIASTKPINTFEEVGKLKFRCTESQINLDWWKAWGVNADTMPWPEVYPALNQKVIDGIEQSKTAIHFLKVDDLTKYILHTDHVVGTWYIVLNKKWYDKLPQDLKTLVVQVIREASAQARVAQLYDECRVIAPMKEKGVTFTPLKPEEDAKFRQAVKEKVWPKWREQIGAEWFDKVLEFVKDVEKSPPME